MYDVCKSAALKHCGFRSKLVFASVFFGFYFNFICTLCALYVLDCLFVCSNYSCWNRWHSKMISVSVCVSSSVCYAFQFERQSAIGIPLHIEAQSILVQRRSFANIFRFFSSQNGINCINIGKEPMDK